MRLLGWIVLAAFLCDGLLSAASDFVPGLLSASNAVTSIAMLLAVVALILAIIGQPRPRAAFFLVPAFYGVAMVLGIVVSILLVQKIGIERMQQVEITPQLMIDEFPWFRPLLYSMHLIHLIIAGYALHLFSREQQRETSNLESI